MTPEEQGEAFRREAERLIAAGELDPIEGDEKFDRAMQAIARKRNRRPQP
ncbi:MAG TPA: hypothetical protein VIA98_12545 [Allosphingosinicella sp.]